MTEFHTQTRQQNEDNNKKRENNNMVTPETIFNKRVILKTLKNDYVRWQ